ncbi:hypothetical protein SR42_03020 [Clostridium botulinum]|nr:hypothetical protein SR42_03020 [Clostridium botulinum]
MSKEIGGFIELENFKGQEYHEELYRFNTTTNAIKYVLINKKYKKVYIPFYLCECVRNMICELNLEYSYYRINERLEPIIDFKVEDNQVVLLVNYFGIYNEQNIRHYNSLFNIIVDNTQVFFQNSIDDIDMVYNCRKFFGVADGAYLNTDVEKEKYDELYRDTSNTRMAYILGRYEKNAQDYYKDFRNNEEILRGLPMMKMSRLTKNLMKIIDYKTIKEIREDNYKYLHSALSNINKLDIEPYENLFMYPLLVNNGNKIRRELITKKVYLPLLWPNVMEYNNSILWEKNLVENMLLLPMDQRYGIDDMDRVLEIVLG